MEFKDYLRTGPAFDDLDLIRSGELPREVDLSALAGSRTGRERQSDAPQESSRHDRGGSKL